ncbi:ABC transporter substrate-binding protein [Sporosarcina sp. G11-34]|uniref:ABC transporter substrate-binding protein n=1 Tax=Sporosarcina sp. G11-34 TaxID=2849605 RepID=UPI0022A9A6C1|nr:ABC transporter substrate-binding protein [Sporosarcina sp. G11-34]MCZ2258516.1 ABC transporter substrate-binding protein [Sporosarcina sp. G11-34]
MGNKKMFFKLVSVMLVSVIALMGCSSSDDGGKDAAKGDQVTVDIFQFKVEIKDQFEDLVKVYEKENPDVKINVKTVGGGNDYGASLKTTFSSGEEPAIFNVGGPSAVEEYREYLADVSDTAAAKVALEGTLNTVTDGDKVLGLPFNQEGYGLIYNKRVFEEAGVNPDDIITYEDLEKAVETIDKQKEELGLDAVFALAAKEKWVIGNHLANIFFAPEFNNDTLEAYNAKSIAFEKSDELKRHLDLESKYSAQPILSLDYSQQVEQLFSLEKVAIIQQGNWIYNSVYDMDPELAEEGIGILPIPVEGFEGSIPAGVPMYWAVNSEKDEKVVQASKDFLDWMYTSETGKTAVLEDFKFVPAYEGYDTSKISDPLSETIYEYASEGNTIAGWVFQGAPTGWSEQVLGAAMQKYLSGEVTWEVMISEAQEKWEAERK